MNPHALALAAGIVLTATAQLLLKSGAAKRAHWLASFTHGRTLAALLLLAVVTVLNVYALQEITLRSFVAWSAVTCVLVLAGSSLALREKMDAARIFGVCLIAGGIILFSLAS